MNLDKLALVLRPRSNWEAIDLGVRMIQSWARPVYAAWLSVYLPIAGLLLLAIGYGLDLPSWAPIVIWWLKPMFDRVVLHVLSHAVFGDVHDWRTVWRTLPTLLWRTDLLRSLTWARFTTMRSLMQPVTQLEGLRGKQASERRRLLARQAGGAASWLTFAMLHFEIIMLLALLGLVWTVLPEHVTDDANPWAWFFSPREDAQELVDYSFAIVDVAIIAFVEPFFVASGFALYLKRRTDLEAWDVELALRRLQSVAPSSSTTKLAGATVALALVAVLASAMVMPTARAADADPNTDPALRAREAIADVMQRPEFGTERTLWRLKYVGPEDDTKRDLSWYQELVRQIVKALKMIGKVIAQIGRVVMWVALALLLGVIVWMIYRYWRLYGDARRRPPNAPPAEVAGFDIRPESLPDDVAAAAMALLAAGKTRAALSLLYRAALSALAHRSHVDFSRGDTEGDCLRRVRTTAVPCAGFFEQLTHAWQDVAYANHEPPLTDLKELCHQWPQYFATPR